MWAGSGGPLVACTWLVPMEERCCPLGEAAKCGGAGCAGTMCSAGAVTAAVAAEVAIECGIVLCWSGICIDGNV